MGGNFNHLHANYKANAQAVAEPLVHTEGTATTARKVEITFNLSFIKNKEHSQWSGIKTHLRGIIWNHTERKDSGMRH